MTFFSNADIPVAFEVLAWAQSFLVEPHSMMKRSPKSAGEPVCPFAKAVLDENALYMAFHHEVNGKSAELIESIVLGYREPFKKTTPFHESDRLKKALLIIFPEIPARETSVLDIVHTRRAIGRVIARQPSPGSGAWCIGGRKAILGRRTHSTSRWACIKSSEDLPQLV